MTRTAVAVARHWESRQGRPSLGTRIRAQRVWLHCGRRIRTALDVGCGTGQFTRWLASRGLEVTGLDLSLAMLAVARDRTRGVRYLQGAAEALPFAEGSFDVAALTTSLELVADQERTPLQAARVARRGLLLGVMNLASPLGLYRRSLSVFRPSRYRHARFFTPWGLERWVCRSLEDRVERVTARTTLWPRVVPLGTSRLPFGGFIGAAVAFKAPKPFCQV